MYDIVIDPGHGGSDPGAVHQASNLREKDLTLKIAQYAEEFLQKNYRSEINVKLTRNSDVSLTLSERCRIANKLNADLFISIHINAGGGTGFESYVYLNIPKDTSEFQSILHNEVMESLSIYGLRNRGEKRADFAVLRGTKMSAVLTENLFIDNDYHLLKKEKFLKELGKSHAKGIVSYLNLI